MESALDQIFPEKLKIRIFDNVPNIPSAVVYDESIQFPCVVTHLAVVTKEINFLLNLTLNETDCLMKNKFYLLSKARFL